MGGVMTVEDWPEIRHLHAAQGMSIRAIRDTEVGLRECRRVAHSVSRPRAVSSGLRPRGSGSTKTEDVRNHAERIYARINASIRAAPGVFSMQHGLLPEEGFPRASLA
jgi:hypothetical protein